MSAVVSRRLVAVAQPCEPAAGAMRTRRSCRRPASGPVAGGLYRGVRCQDARMGLGRNLLFRVATSKRLERAVKRVPGGEPAAWRAASRYVAGRSRSGALAIVEMLLERGHGVSVDLFGERVSDPAVADRVLEDYLGLAVALPPPPADVWLSVDLSHLALRVDAAAAADRLAAIADALPVGRRVQVGAEEAALADRVYACVLAV